MNTKLILVEGLPGSGKSTTAELIHELASKSHHETELYLEGNLDHPADYDGVAFFSEEEYESLLSSSPAEVNQLKELTFKTNRGYFIPYKKQGGQLPEQVMNAVYMNDIYELPFNLHMEFIKEKWRDFAKMALESPATYVFECCFIQNPVTMGMIKCGVSDREVLIYIKELESIIMPLNPILIYVDQDDIEGSFKKAVQERPANWSEGFIHYYNENGYGKQQQVKGLEGTLKVLEARNELEKHIYQSLKMKKEKINNSEFNREQHIKIVGNILNQML